MALTRDELTAIVDQIKPFKNIQFSIGTGLINTDYHWTTFYYAEDGCFNDRIQISPKCITHTLEVRKGKGIRSKLCSTNEQIFNMADPNCFNNVKELLRQSMLDQLAKIESTLSERLTFIR